MIPILEKFVKGIQCIFDCFSKTFLKTNADKCHMIGSYKVPVDIQIPDIEVNSLSRVKLFVIYIDNK